MRLFNVCAAGLIGIAIAGCWSRDTDGDIVTPDPVAGLRFINLVSDTSALTFRVVDVVNNAPNTIGASFRTGGNPYGSATTLMPPYFAVDVGERHIKVFLTSTVDTLASTVLLDTLYTFVQNQNYTFFLYGTARSGTAGHCCSWTVTKDSVPTLATGKIALRVINLAPDYTGALGPGGVPAPGSGIDFRIAAATAPAPTVAPVLSNVLFGAVSAYNATIDTSSATVPYKLFVTANGSAVGSWQALLPLGIRGSAIANPIAGTAVAGSAITAIVVPRSTSPSLAPQGGLPASVAAGIDSVLFKAPDTVIVVRNLVAGNGTSTCATAAGAGVAANDILLITGLTQPEYNGLQSVQSIVAGTNQTVNTPFSCSGGVRSRFKYRITGTPVSPATGAMAYRIYTGNATDYTAPQVLFLIDAQPPRTAP